MHEMKNVPDAARLLRAHGLRDTQSRRMVLTALAALNRPATPTDIHAWISAHDNATNLVTVYRVAEALEKAGIAHRHPDNTYTACTMPEHGGHHGFLHCLSCGIVQEFCDPALCKMENAIARKAGFVPTSHLSAIKGTCTACVR